MVLGRNVGVKIGRKVGDTVGLGVGFVGLDDGLLVD